MTIRLLRYAACLSALSAQLHAARPNFIVIIADDMAWTDSGAYGHPSIRTPNLDKLAADGMRFDRAFLTTSSCSPSRASIMTGRYPHNTEAPELHSQMPATQVMMTQPLGDAGYYTASVGKWHLGDNVKNQVDLVIEDKVGSGAVKWISTLEERPSDKPFFFWFASNDPHRPYKPKNIEQVNDPATVIVPPYYPDTPEVRRDLADYYDEISRLDSDVGLVRAELERQGIAENTFILFMSDNGRPFPMCKTRLTDEGIKTPFIITYPKGVEAGGTCQSLVSAVDIMPTVLELAGIDIPDTVQGTSFAPVLKNPQAKIRDVIFAEHNWHDFKSFERGVRNSRYTYIHNSLPELAGTPPADAVGSPTYQVMRKMRDAGELTELQMDSFVKPRAAEFLYDNEKDPFSTKNLIKDPEYQRVVKQLREELKSWSDRTSDSMPEKLTPDLFDRETGEMLPEHPNYKK